MKHTVKTLIASLIITIFSTTTAVGQKSEDLRPVTQYSIVETSDYGASLRDRSSISRILTNMGFNVRTFDRPQSMDDMDDFTELVATRRGDGGSTRIHYSTGEDNLCTIIFANRSELNEFVASMEKSGYSKDGTLYSHPANVPGMGMVYVRIKGLTAKIISPFEMLGTNF